MILVTGGTGLLGSHLIRQLLREGKKVRATFRKGSDRSVLEKALEYYKPDPPEILENLEWQEADLLDVTVFEKLLEGVTQVYHCAALVSFDSSDQDKLMEVNPTITANLVNATLDFPIEKLVHVSSVAALGRKSQSGHIDEKSSWVDGKQNSVYAKSKYLSELEVWRGIQEGLNAVIVNPSIILGAGHWTQGSSALFHTIAGGFKYYTLGANAYVDVRDVVSIMIRLMESDIKGERFVVAAENISYKKFFEYVAHSLGVKTPHKEVQPWLSGIIWRIEKLRSFFTGKKPVVTRETARTAQSTYYYENDKVKKQLQFEFRPVKETVRDITHEYRKWPEA